MSLEQAPIDLGSEATSQIRNILADFLDRCDIPPPRNAYLDKGFQEACYADAVRRGIDILLVKKSLDAGIGISAGGYRHLKNYSTRIFIAVWTGLLIHIDDCYKFYSDGLEVFFDRFMRRQPQRHKILDQIVTMIHEIPNSWGPVATNLIFGSTLDFLTSPMIDTAIEGMEIQVSVAPFFPLFNRRINGVSRAYAVMIFPPELDLKTWMQVIPDTMFYIDHVNDLLSFFKEELEGETLNFISMSASSQGITKTEALKGLAEETVQMYSRGAKLLQSSPEAFAAFREFTIGFVGAHALSARYKLDQLNL